MLLRRVVRDTRQNFSGPDSGVSLPELSNEGLFQAEELIKVFCGEEYVKLDGLMLATDPIDTAVALHDTHRVPGKVIVHNVCCLLQVHPFSKHVCGQQDVVQISFHRAAIITKLALQSGGAIATAFARVG